MRIKYVGVESAETVQTVRQGDFFVRCGEEYILARTGHRFYTMVSLRSGNRWHDPTSFQETLDKINQDEVFWKHLGAER